MTRSLRVVAALLGLSLLALTLTGSPIYSRLSYLWGLLLLGSWVWSALALRGVQVRREARIRRAQMGQIFQERFEIRNSSRMPRVWMEVRDESGLPASRGSLVISMRGAWKRRSYTVRTRLLQRGVFSLGPTVLASGDPFGLFPVSRTLPATSTLLVYPFIAQLSAITTSPGLLPGGEALRRLTHQVTPNAAGVREYAPGDPLNRIHWMSTARRNRLMVKEFELDPMADVWIVLDAAHGVQSALMHSPPSQTMGDIWGPSTREVALPPSTEEYGVSIVASLGRYFIRRGRAVGLVSCSQAQSPEVLPPDRGARQLGKILEAMAILHAGGDLPISALVAAQAQHLPRGSTVVLITPSVQQEVALTADHLLRLGLRLVVVLLDAASFGGLPGTESLARTIAGLGVPQYIVTNGVDLATALSLELRVAAV